MVKFGKKLSAIKVCFEAKQKETSPVSSLFPQNAIAPYWMYKILLDIIEYVLNLILNSFIVIETLYF